MPPAVIVTIVRPPSLVPTNTGAPAWLPALSAPFRDSSIPTSGGTSPTTLRANSIVAHCRPRQIPKKGNLLSRANRMASIFPSIPRLSKPPVVS